MAYSKYVVDSPDLLLSVDCGIRAGLALYTNEARLLWFESHNYGNRPALRRGVQSVFQKHPNIAWLIIEGGGPVADIWKNYAKKQFIKVRQIDAEKWRNELFYKKEQRNGSMAKQNADTLARKMISYSGIALPKKLRHDAAEAILIGLWGLLDTGWIDEIPAELRK
ncbi:MAG: hypothetical protein K9I94_03015 [Bacteroidales bacterium]|nr:hypothetical protein [Bacteroidales bacterium]